MNVYQKLNEARDLFHQAPLKKSGHNKFAGYSYFELGDFVVPVLEIFKQVGLTSIISFKQDEATMQIINTDKPEEVVTITTPMSEANLKAVTQSRIWALFRVTFGDTFGWLRWRLSSMTRLTPLLVTRLKRLRQHRRRRWLPIATKNQTQRANCLSSR
jgi:hypothetical protein